MRQAPPTRASTSQTGFVKPFGPHHRASCFPSVQALKTVARGASKIRVITISCSLSCRPPLAPLPALLASMLLLLFFQFGQIVIETIEAFSPKHSVVLHPVRNVLERSGL